MVRKLRWLHLSYAVMSQSRWAWSKQPRESFRRSTRLYLKCLLPETWRRQEQISRSQLISKSSEGIRSNQKEWSQSSENIAHSQKRKSSADLQHQSSIYPRWKLKNCSSHQESQFLKRWRNSQTLLLSLTLQTLSRPREQMDLWTLRIGRFFKTTPLTTSRSMCLVSI